MAETSRSAPGWSGSNGSDGPSRLGMALAAEPAIQAVARCLSPRDIGAGAVPRESRAAL